MDFTNFIIHDYNMNKMDNNKGTPNKGASSENDYNFDNHYNNEYSSKPEIEEPNPPNATPAIPEEMPIRESK